MFQFNHILILLVCPYEEKPPNSGSLIFAFHCSNTEVVLPSQGKLPSGPQFCLYNGWEKTSKISESIARCP